MNKRKKFSPGGCFSYVYLIVLSVVSVFPLLWLLVSAFKSSGEMLAHPTTFLPIDWTLENFKTVLFTLKFTVNIKNSLIVALCTTVIATFISALAAYGIIRFFPKLGNIMTKILITTYMFPSIMLVIPYAVVMNVLHLTNSRVGLLLVSSSTKTTLSVAVKTLEGADILNWGSMMAASAIVVLPSIIFFCMIQNKIAGGLADGAVK